MKKLLFVDHAIHLGGGERVLLTLLSNLNNEKYDITVLVPGEGKLTKELENLSIKYKIIKPNSMLLHVKRGSKINIINKFKIAAGMFVFVHRIIKYVKNEKFDVIYTNSMKAHIYGSLVAWRTKIPLIWRVHDILTDLTFNKSIKKIFVEFSKHFPNRILPVSRAVQDSMISNGSDKGLFNIIYNSVSNIKYEDKKSYYHKLFNIDNKKIIVGIVGWLIPWKGQDIFINAAEKVIKKNENIHFVIVGGPLEGGESYARTLKEMVKSLNIESHVTFTGHISDIPGIYSFIDIAVHCSVEPDPLPTVILESMAYRTPIVAVNDGGVPEIISDKKSGRLYNCGDSNMLSSIILELSYDQVLCKQYVDNAVKNISEKFSIESYVTQHETIIDSL